MDDMDAVLEEQRALRAEHDRRHYILSLAELLFVGAWHWGDPATAAKRCLEAASVFEKVSREYNY